MVLPRNGISGFRLIIVTLLSLALTAGYDACNDTTCVQVDFKDCDNAVRSMVVLDCAEWLLDETGFPVAVRDAGRRIEPVLGNDSRRVSGKEVNWGFWSKNTPRDDSFEELFRWKNGRWPTETESRAISEDQARKWFIERYTNYGMLETDPPQDVQVYRRTLSREYCFQGAYGPSSKKFFEFSGYIQFPDGRRCNLVCPLNSSVFTIEKPCAACNEDSSIRKIV